MRKVNAPRRTAALFVASASVLLVAACGGGSDGGGTTAGNNGNGGGGNNAFAAYTECLAKNGVTITMPSRQPREGASGFPEGGRRSGFPSGQPRPSGSFGGGGRGGFPGGLGKPVGVDEATWQKAQQACASVRPSFGAGNRRGNGADTAYLNCLKENGVTDPSKIDSADATTSKALETCKVLRPQASPTPTA
ncbi:hypothetical protein GCM10010172_74220 [Paractinoplanes ferrugineus]|uniref:PT repeat-containing protein n=1 Tax=Paractinoplanes ferrugineus TaxID=113564 RepID=A0A919J120_9ACTN|nr:hypothetical protein [Actinoplanes ferrugineus]GIE11422.1 hypothetical protein Afe05nite_32620 [Actinoplanes ferrugineus]